MARHDWDEEERFVLHHGFYEKEFKLSRADMLSIFIHLFGKNWPENEQPDEKKIYEEWNFRKSTGRAKVWREKIDKDTYDQAEEAKRNAVRTRIQQAAAALNINITHVTLPQYSNPPAAPRQQSPYEVAAAAAGLPERHSNGSNSWARTELTPYLLHRLDIAYLCLNLDNQAIAAVSMDLYTSPNIPANVRALIALMSLNDQSFFTTQAGFELQKRNSRGGQSGSGGA